MHIELGSSQISVQQCVLSWAVGEKLGDELARLARRKWRWSKAEVEVEKAEAKRTRKRRVYFLIKSYNPYLIGGEKISIKIFTKIIY